MKERILKRKINIKWVEVNIEEILNLLDIMNDFVVL
jgi:hypothetical protein